MIDSVLSDKENEIGTFVDTLPSTASPKPPSFSQLNEQEDAYLFQGHETYIVYNHTGATWTKETMPTFPSGETAICWCFSTGSGGVLLATSATYQHIFTRGTGAYPKRYTYWKSIRSTLEKPISGTLVAISRDGQAVAVAFESKIEIYKLVTGSFVLDGTITLPGTAQNVTSLSFSSDGIRLAWVSGDANTYVAQVWVKSTSWALEFNVPRVTHVTYPTNYTSTISMSGDGTRVALGSRGIDASMGAVSIHVRTGSWSSTPETTIRGAANTAFGAGLSLNHTGSRLVVGLAVLQQFYVYSRAGSWVRDTGTLTAPDGSGGSAAWIGYDVAIAQVSDNKIVATDRNDGRIFVWKRTAATTWQDTPEFVGAETAEDGKCVAIDSAGTYAAVSTDTLILIHFFNGTSWALQKTIQLSFSVKDLGLHFKETGGLGVEVGTKGFNLAENYGPGPTWDLNSSLNIKANVAADSFSSARDIHFNAIAASVSTVLITGSQGQTIIR